MLIKQTDSMDIPNAPTVGARLPDERDLLRKPQAPTPWRLIAIAAIVCAVVLLMSCVAFWPIAQAFGESFRQALTDHADFISTALAGAVIVIIGAGVAAGTSMLFGLARRIHAAADQAGVVRLQNDAPVQVRDLKLPDVRNALVGSVDRSYQTLDIYGEHSGKRAMQTYAPNMHYSYQSEGTAPGEQPILPVPEAPALPALPSGRVLETLRERGHICRSGRSLLVGYAENGEPQYIDLDGTGFVGIGGKTRQGKTSTVTFLIAQAVLSGWHVFICDPHLHKPSSLLKRLEPLSGALTRQATTPEEITTTIRMVDKIGQRRLSGENPIDRSILLVVDELTNLVLHDSLPKEVYALLPAMATGYAGVHIHGLLIGHDWSSRMLGPTLGAVLRRATTHSIAHRLDEDAAEYLLPSGAIARQAEQLVPGQAIFFGDDSPVTVRVPWIAVEDLTYAAQGKTPKPYAPRPQLTAPAPTPAAPPQQPITQALAPQTIADLICQRLAYVPDQTVAELARDLGHDEQVIRNICKDLHEAGVLGRQQDRRSYRYRIVHANM